jgi:hypothetical protein
VPGSTWSQNALDQWRKNVAANYGMTVNYSGIGIIGRPTGLHRGNSRLRGQRDPVPDRARGRFGPSEKPTSGFAYMPIAAGGTLPMYNLEDRW